MLSLVKTQVGTSAIPGVHRARAAWNPDTLGMYLSRLIVRTLLPDGAVLTVAIDDTLFKNHGRCSARRGNTTGPPAASSRSGSGSVARPPGPDHRHHPAPGLRRALRPGNSQTVRVVLIRDDGTDTGYDLALVTTDLTDPTATLVSRYAWRWSIEVTFLETRDHLGAGQARNRTRLAIERTTPFALYCYTIVIVWYPLHGHRPADVADHRERQPWNTTKAEPAFADLTATSAA